MNNNILSHILYCSWFASLDANQWCGLHDGKLFTTASNFGRGPHSGLLLTGLSHRQQSSWPPRSVNGLQRSRGRGPKMLKISTKKESQFKWGCFFRIEYIAEGPMQYWDLNERLIMRPYWSQHSSAFLQPPIQRPSSKKKQYRIPASEAAFWQPVQPLKWGGRGYQRGSGLEIVTTTLYI